MATRIAHIREATLAPMLAVPSAEGWYLVAKRLLDVTLALVLLVVLAPLLVLIAVAIVLDSRGPVIFRQQRVQGDQRPGTPQPEGQQFAFFKFRTMHHRCDQQLHQEYVTQLIKGHAQVQTAGGQGLYKLAQDSRITRVGRLLRKTSLDELPQLFNIIVGDMSFVGPRPALPYEVQQYKPWHLYRLSVTQGLTGLWQVMGRNTLSFDEMVQLDIEYARRRSLWLDVKIMAATIPVVILGRGVC